MAYAVLTKLTRWGRVKFPDFSNQGMGNINDPGALVLRIPISMFLDLDLIL